MACVLDLEAMLCGKLTVSYAALFSINGVDDMDFIKRSKLKMTSRKTIIYQNRGNSGILEQFGNYCTGGFIESSADSKLIGLIKFQGFPVEFQRD